MSKLTGAVLTIGSLVFLLPLATPVVVDVFGTSDVEARAAFIAGSPAAWDVVHVLLSIGSLVVGLALVMFAGTLRRSASDATASLLGWLGAVAAMLGAGFWVVISLFRITRAPEVVAANMNSASWLFVGFAVCTSVAIAVAGLAILRSGIARWLGWLEVALGAALLVAYLILGDMLPAAFYLPLLLMGVVFLTAAPRQRVASS